MRKSPASFGVVQSGHQPQSFGRATQHSARVRQSASHIWRIEADGILSATWNSMHGLPNPGGYVSYLCIAFIIDRACHPIDSPSLWMTTVAVHIGNRTMCFVRDFEDFVKDAPHLYYEAVSLVTQTDSHPDLAAHLHCSG